MKPAHAISILSSAALLVTGCDTTPQPPAQVPPQRPAPDQSGNGPPPRGPQLSPDEMMRRADTDGDGAISHAEHAAAAAREAEMRFSKTDANRDGRITRDEMKAPPPRS